MVVVLYEGMYGRVWYYPENNMVAWVDSRDGFNDDDKSNIRYCNFDDFMKFVRENFDGCTYELPELLARYFGCSNFSEGDKVIVLDGKNIEENEGTTITTVPEVNLVSKQVVLGFDACFIKMVDDACDFLGIRTRQKLIRMAVSEWWSQKQNK